MQNKPYKLKIGDRFIDFYSEKSVRELLDHYCTPFIKNTERLFSNVSMINSKFQNAPLFRIIYDIQE